MEDMPCPAQHTLNLDVASIVSGGQPVFSRYFLMIFICSRELVATVMGYHTSTISVSR